MGGGVVPPKNATERRSFKEDFVLRGARALNDEDNFREAAAAAHIAFADTGAVSPEIRVVLDDPAAADGTSAIAADLAAGAGLESASTGDEGGGGADLAIAGFWLLVAALRRFVETEGEGCLPLEGSIPDMTSTTDAYLALQ